MKWLRRLLIFFGVLAVLLGIAYMIFCSWLKTELEKRAHEVLGVAVKIGDVGLSLGGSLVLEDIEVSDLPLQGDKTSIKLAKATPDFDLLFGKKVRVTELYVSGLSLRTQMTIPALPPMGDIKKIKKILSSQPKKEKSVTLPQPLQSIIVENSSLELMLTVGKAKPNLLSLSNISYQNQNIDTINPTSLLTASSFSFDMGSGHIERKPGSFIAKNIDLSLLSTLLSPSDYFKFSTGTMNLQWKDGVATIDLKKVTLSKAISLLTANTTFDLSFTIPIASDSESADVKLIASEFWIGLWDNVLKTATDEVKKSLIQEAAKAVLGGD